jgi:nicotinamide riboside kinase
MKKIIGWKTLRDDNDLDVSVSSLKYEWWLAIQSFGKILLLTGPSSSGKTTLLSKFLKTIPNLYTINRKVQLYEVNTEVDKLFFSGLLSEVSDILGQRINGKQLYELRIDDTHSSLRGQDLKILHNKFLAIIKSEFFIRTYSGMLFTKYYNEIKKHIFAGNNIVIDDSSLYSKEYYDQFKFCCANYPNIRRVLLFTTIEDTLKNCVTRNDKFAIKLSTYPLNRTLDEIIKEQEITSGGSSDCYRLPKSIIQNYKDDYKISPYIKNSTIVLASSMKDELESVFYKVSIEQFRILGLLAYRGIIIKRDYVEIEKEINRIFLGNPKVYFISTENFDYILETAKIFNLSGMELLVQLDEILEWFNVNLALYSSNPQTLTISGGSTSIAKVTPKEQNVKILYPLIGSNLYYSLDDKRNVAILKRFENVDELNKIADLIIRDVLARKTITLLFSIQDYDLSQAIIEFDEEKTIKFIYYHPNLISLENDPIALSSIPFFFFAAREYGYNTDIYDLSRCTSGDVIYRNFGSKFLTLHGILPNFYQSHFYAEWAIWSKCFGKVVVINGVSSTGKTTLCEYLETFGFNLFSRDNIKDEIIKTQHSVHKTEMEIYARIYNKAKEFIFCGRDVVIDTVADDLDIEILTYCFNYYPIVLGLLYSSLEENLKKCIQRNVLAVKNEELFEYRDLSLVIKQYNEFYKFIPQHNLFVCSKAFEKINVDSIERILGIVEYYEIRLLDTLEVSRDQSDYKTRISWLYSSIKVLRDTLDLISSEELVVVPKVKFDFFIQNLGITKFPELTLENFELFIKEMSIKPKHDLSDTKFLIYYEDSLQPLIGEQFIIEEF